MQITHKKCLAAMLLLAFSNQGGVLAQMHGDDAHAGPAMNFHRVDERLATGGHFVNEGLADLHAQGVRVVIDLRDEPPKDQKETVEKLGIKWINVPVVWESPQRADFERFSER